MDGEGVGRCEACVDGEGGGRVQRHVWMGRVLGGVKTWWGGCGGVCEACRMLWECGHV